MWRTGLFYGWYIVAAGLLIRVYNSGMFIYGFTAFIAPIAATSGWSYTQITLATSLRGLETGVLDPLLGMAADRWPARRLVLIGIIIFGLGALCISQATNLAMFYIGFLIMGFGSSLGVIMVPTTVIARWFRRDIGKATVIVTMGTSIGGALVPVLTKMIDTYGWQNSLLFMAVGMWILGIPLSLVFRDRPEEHSPLPSSKPPDDVKERSGSQGYDFGVGIKEALRMWAFWAVGIASMLQMGPLMAVMTHVMPHLENLGVARETAGMVAMLIALVTIPARLPFGWLADILPTKYVFAMTNLLTSAGLFLFWLIDGNNFGLIVLFVIVFGVGTSAVRSLLPPLIKEYFGTKKFGTIFGSLSIFGTIGTILFPPVAGWVFDTLGYYGPIWLIFSGFPLIGLILILTVPVASKS